MSGIRWGGYPRISDDSLEERAGVLRQREDIAAGVRMQGGDPDGIVWFEENDTSAYKKRRVQRVDALGEEYVAYRVIRPVWHQALAALRSGKIDALMVWDMDRLARDPRDMEDAIEVVQHFGKKIVDSSNQVDLTTEYGQMFARLAVIMGNKSSADTARRVARAHLANAQTGRPVGGTRPFGWEDDKVTVVPEERAAIQMAAQALLAGESLASTVRRFNELGLPTSRGNPWNSQTLRQMLRSPRYAGWRVHQGKVATDAQGQPVRGLWEPILDQETFDRLQLLFDRPDRRTRKPRRDGRHYLLTGLVRCGICNAVMYGNRHTGGKFYYVCNEQRVKNHGLGGSGLAIDRLVTKYVRMKMDEAAEREGPIRSSEWSRQARFDEIGLAIQQLMAEVRSGDSGRSSGDIYREVGDLEDEKAELEKDRTRWLESTTGPVLTRVTDEEWDEMSLDRKRAQIETVLEAVIVKPATRRGNSFDPDRLEFVPRQRPAT